MNWLYLLKTTCLVAGLVVLVSLVAPFQALAQDKPKVHWGYTGDAGPANWAKLSAEFEICDS